MAFPDVQDTKKLYNRDDLRALYESTGSDDRRFELIDGEIYEMPSGTLLHSFIIQTLFLLLGNYVKNQSLGIVFGDGTEYNLPNGDTVIPDLSFVTGDRMPALTEKFMYIAPDLAVEVISPSNKPQPTLKKTNGYLDSGTRLVWEVYPEEFGVAVYARQDSGSVEYKWYGLGDTLTGESIIPGLTLPVAAIFPMPKPAAPQSET